MQYIDMLISIFQSILFIYIINYCLGKGRFINNKAVILSIMLLSLNGFIIPHIFGDLSACISIFISHILCMLIIFLFFREKYVQALISYSLMYYIVAVWIFIFGNILYGILKSSVSQNYMGILNVILVYMSQAVLFVLCFILKNKIKQIYSLIVNGEGSISYIILMSFIPDFFVSLYLISYEMDNLFYSKLVIIALVIFLGVSAMHFYKIVLDGNRVYRLNKILANKNTELKDIKNEYGLQLLYLYELSNGEKFNEVTGLLKNIISSNQNDTNVTEGITKDYSLLSLATRHVKCEDINITVEDSANFKLTDISELELYRVIVNIVNNAIKAMKNRGNLIVKSYENLENIIIKIENDGEEIPEDVIHKIFEPGFTTKNNNNKNHGYGLSIVKELIENYNGTISVKSSSSKTEFIIALPIKEAT